MSFDFPSAPSEGQTYSPVTGVTYAYYAPRWTALDVKAPLASPALTGNPTAPTPTAGDNDTSVATTAFVTTAVATATVPPATVAPLMDGAAAVGTTTKYAREDHRHPTDTTLAPIASPTFTGVPAAPTATVGTSTTQLATTAFVGTAITNAAVPGPATVTPLMDGTAAVGTTTKYAREDHRHPTDTSREATITAGTTAQYWRGDKTFQTLDKAAVGLGNVDNTSDASKPVSTAGAAADALRVLKVGDTMTGDLTITKAAAALLINPTSGQGSLNFYRNSSLRWQWLLQNDAESGGNAGSTLMVTRNSDAGAFIDVPLQISRVNGQVMIAGTLSAGNSVSAVTIAATTGGLNVTVPSGNALTTHTVSGVRSWIDGCVSNGHFWVQDTSSGTIHIDIDPALGVMFSTSFAAYLGGGMRGRQGSNASGYVGSNHNWAWTGTVIQAWVDNTNTGNITVSSDYRIKKDVVELSNMWETVKLLRPIRYTQAEFTPPIEKAIQLKEAMEAADKGKEAKPAPGPLFVADDVERWGFVAHELQETLIENAATGYKDSPDTVQSPNPWTVIAALTKALQEAMVRIEALEARG